MLVLRTVCLHFALMSVLMWGGILAETPGGRWAETAAETPGGRWAETVAGKLSVMQALNQTGRGSEASQLQIQAWMNLMFSATMNKGILTFTY